MNDLQSIRELFEQALSCPPSEREALVQRARRCDPSTADLLERLLEEDQHQEPTLMPPAASDPPAPPIADSKPDSFRHRFAPMGRESSGTSFVLPPDAPTIDGIRLEGVIGSGGLGRVYRARDGDRVVAVKVPRADRLDPSLIDRWVEECRLAHALPPHPNLVTVHRLTIARFNDGTEVPAMIMEYLPGALDLLTFAGEHGLGREQRLELVDQACRGVGHLHGRGVVHGDIKPNNLLVIETPDGPLVKVGDLGGTRTLLRHDSRPLQFTWTYASPEQILDDPVKIGPQSDVYSLGKVLWALICGVDSVKLPAGTDRNEYARWRPPALVDRLGMGDDRLEQCMTRAVSRGPSDRHETAHDLRVDLSKCHVPRLHRTLLAVGDWLNPPGPARRRAAIFRRAMLLTVVAAIAVMIGVVACNVNVRSTNAFQMYVPIQVPETIEHVALLRLRDREELISFLASRDDERFASLTAGTGLDRVDVNDVFSLRHLWAATLPRLAELGAAVIVMDIVFPQLNNELDDVIVRGVDDARKAGAAVVAAVRSPRADLGPSDIGPKLLAEADAIGHIHLQPHVPGLGAAIMVVDREGAAPRLPLAIAAVVGSKAEVGARNLLQIDLDPARSQVIIRSPRPPAQSIPMARFTKYDPQDPDMTPELLRRGVTPGERIGFYIFDLPPDEVIESSEIRLADLFDEDAAPQLRRKLAGKIVLVATNANPFDPDLHPYRSPQAGPDAPERTVPGSWFHVAAIESMMIGLAGPQVGLINLAYSVGAGVVAALLGWWIGTVSWRWRKAVRSPRRKTFATLVLTMAWVATLVGAPTAVFALGIAFEWRMQYLVALAGVVLLIAFLFGIGLSVRAAWGRRVQTAMLREVTHAW